MSERISRDGSQPRTPRTLQTRESEARFVYQPPSALPVPNPEPGYNFRWVSTHMAGEADDRNVSKRFREGYEPVKASDHPELMLKGDANGNAVHGNLMLCKIPEERVKARNAHYAGQAQAQMESVDNSFMRSNDPRMPLFSEKKSSISKGVKFGSGSN